MTQYSYSKEIANAVKTHLDSNDWNYSFNEEKGLFTFNVSISNRMKKIRYALDVRDSEYIVYGICPIGANADDKEEMLRMAEFLTRANYGIKNGCFEMDFRDGEIRYKSYVDCEGQLPGDGNISDSIGAVYSMYKKYGDGIAKVVFTDISAEEAEASC